MSAAKTVSLHQQLVNEALESARVNKLSYDEMFDSLDYRHKAAIVLKNLNFQVTNGGFSQWVENDYHEEIEFVVECLKKIGTEAANLVINILEDFDKLYQTYGEDEDIDDEYHQLDCRYSELEKEILADINVWLATLN